MFILNAETRTPGHAELVRAKRNIPAICYGPDTRPVSVSVPYQPFAALYEEAGEATLVDFLIDGASTPVKVLIQDVQFDPVTDRILHIDFRQINMREEMQATVELRFIGESSAVKGLGGTLMTPRSELKVKCLPKDLVGHIDIDLSMLKTFDDMIHVREISLPPGITTLDDAELVIAKVARPFTEEELKAMEESGPKSVEDVEVVEKKEKKEDGEEGEEAAPADAAKDQKKEEKK